MLTAAFFAVPVVLDSEPALAQDGVTIAGCEGGDFGDQCSLHELETNSGVSIEIDLPEKGLRLVFDAFNASSTATGVEPSEFEKIRVTAGATTSSAFLHFNDEGPLEWAVRGGGNTEPNAMTTTIEYRVRAFDRATGQPARRLNGAELAVRFGRLTTDDPDSRPPVEASVDDTVLGTNGLPVGKLFANLRAPLPTLPDSHRRTDSEFFASQAELTIRKELDLRPRESPNNVVEIDAVRQYVGLTADEEVGCVPGTINPADGGEIPVEHCALPPGTQPRSAPIALANGSVGVPTFDPVTGDDYWHLTMRAVAAAPGPSYFDYIVNLSQSIPQPQDPGNTIEPGGFHSSGGLLSFTIEEREPVFFSAVDALVRLFDLITGDFEDVARIGDSVTVDLGTFEIVALGNTRLADDGTVMVDAELARPNDPRIRPSVLVYDVSGLLFGGAATLIDSFVPGDIVETDRGFVTLGESVSISANHSTIGSHVIASADPSSGESFRLLFSPGQLPKLVAMTGDPTGLGRVLANLSFLLSLNGWGDIAGVGTTIDPSAQIPSTTSRAIAALFPAMGGIVPVIENGEPVPGVPGGVVGNQFFGRLGPGGLYDIAINDGGQGMVDLEFQDNDGIFRSGILEFDFDPTGAIADVVFQDSPLILSGDAVTVDGTARVVGPSINDITIGPQSIGADTRVISIAYSDGTRAVLVVPSEAPAPRVPDVIGLPETDAEAAIVAAGLAVGVVTTQNSDTVPAGDVISQSPAAGTEAVEGDAVDLVVSSGPAPVQGDVDGDSDVDRADIGLITAARKQPASGPDDPRDLDGDGMITVLDARMAVTMCTRARCATE